MTQETLDKEILKTIIEGQEKHIHFLKSHILTLKQLINGESMTSVNHTQKGVRTYRKQEL